VTVEFSVGPDARRSAMDLLMACFLVVRCGG
jgi:hypothetical protein